MTDFMALDNQHHQETGWHLPANYQFAANQNIVPISAGEMSDIMTTMPIAWAKRESGQYDLVCVLGITPGQNLFVHPKTYKWITGYIPSQLRAYPFAMLPIKGEPDKRALCIDKDSGLIDSTHKLGTLPFYENGHHSTELAKIVETLKKFEFNRVQTQKATQALAEHNLFKAWPILHKDDSGRVSPLTGLYRIDDEALRNLNSEQLSTLMACDALGVAYGQLLSIKRIDLLRQLHKTLSPHMTQQTKTHAPEHSDVNLDDYFGEGDDSLFKF